MRTLAGDSSDLWPGVELRSELLWQRRPHSTNESTGSVVLGPSRPFITQSKQGTHAPIVHLCAQFRANRAFRVVVWDLDVSAKPDDDPLYDSVRGEGYDVDVASPAPITRGAVRIHPS